MVNVKLNKVKFLRRRSASSGDHGRFALIFTLQYRKICGFSVSIIVFKIKHAGSINTYYALVSDWASKHKIGQLQYRYLRELNHYLPSTYLN